MSGAPFDPMSMHDILKQARIAAAMMPRRWLSETVTYMCDFCEHRFTMPAKNGIAVRCSECGTVEGFYILD